MTKKLLALLLALLLLTGCTGQNNAPEGTTAPVQTDPAAPEDDGLAPLTVHYIDVGQADCALLECGGKYALIDGGNAADGDAVVGYLKDQGVETLELVVGTHPHEDHIGGLPDVIENFDVKYAWFSHYPYTNSIVNAFLNWCAIKDVPVIEPSIGYVFTLGDAVLNVLGPVRTDYEDVNDLSLIIRVDHGDRRYLFVGDQETLAENDLLDSGADVKADVLKVGHHGSYSSSGYRFLREVQPSYGVISVGGNNSYGHPHEAALSRLQDADVTIFRTDKMFTIVSVCDGTDITFTWDNEYASP